MKDETWNHLLKHALAPTEEPSAELNGRLMARMREPDMQQPPRRRKWPAALLAAMVTLLLSTTALAVSQLLSSGQVAEEAGRHALAKAFESRRSIKVNQSAVSGGYRFTLQGLVSGRDLEEVEEAAGTLRQDRTYAAVSIERQDGQPMPGNQDEQYGKIPFFVSPYVKGEKPWQVNIATLGGGYSEFVKDGIMYRLIECDGLEMFADKGVYIGISTSPFFDSEAFRYDEMSGEISAKADYRGAAVLFPLPLDAAKADHAQADAYLQKILQPEDTPAKPGESHSGEQPDYLQNLKNLIADGETISGSVKAVTLDEKGWVSYSYDGWDYNAPVSELFAEGQSGQSDSLSFSGKDGEYMALVFTKDDSGTITGRIVKLKEKPAWPE